MPICWRWHCHHTMWLAHNPCVTIWVQSHFHFSIYSLVIVICNDFDVHLFSHYVSVFILPVLRFISKEVMSNTHFLHHIFCLLLTRIWIGGNRVKMRSDIWLCNLFRKAREICASNKRINCPRKTYHIRWRKISAFYMVLLYNEHNDYNGWKHISYLT